jgi:hypothetical protein
MKTFKGIDGLCLKKAMRCNGTICVQAHDSKAVVADLIFYRKWLNKDMKILTILA